MTKTFRIERAWGIGLLTAAALMVADAAFATRAAISVRGRMITVELPADSPVEAYDRTRDYDFEIMRDGLAFAEACLTEGLNLNPGVVLVPGWPALMGLSTRLRQLERIIGEQRFGDAVERRHYDRFINEERAALRPGISFVRTNERMSAQGVPVPLDFNLYVRAAVAWLRGYETHKLETWLLQRTQGLPPFTLRTPRPAPTLVRAAEIIKLDQTSARRRTSCGGALGGDNVVPFRRNPGT